MRIARHLTVGLMALLICAAAGAGIQMHRNGYRAYIVHTGSMDGTYNSGDLVIDKPFSGSVHVGEVITFLHSGLSSDVVTHRIVSLDNGTIQTKGDANPTKDAWNIRYDQVKGVVVTSIPKGGFVVYFFKQPAGVAAAVTGVIALILLYGLFFGDPPPVKRSGSDADAEPAMTDLAATPTLAQAIRQLRQGQSLADAGTTSRL